MRADALTRWRPGPRDVTVGLVAVPDTTPGVLFSMLEVFAAIGSVWAHLTGEAAGGGRMRPRVVGASTGLQRCGLGVPVPVDAGFDEALRFDVVVVPDIGFDPALEPRGRWPAAARWLLDQHAAGAVVCSVCTGSLVLAESGLLDGLDATSHWAAAPLFERHYPQVRIEPRKVIVPAGAGHRIVTAGGYASWTELVLYLVARFLGEAEAVRTSKAFLLGDRGEGQLPFAAMVRPRGHGDAVIERCQRWLAEHCDDPRPLAAAVAASGLSVRTFERRFRAATGYRPTEYLQTLRVEEAKQLLETTALPTDDVAAAVGYQDPASFRRTFRRLVGVTPACYRRRVQDLLRLRAAA